MGEGKSNAEKLAIKVFSDNPIDRTDVKLALCVLRDAGLTVEWVTKAYSDLIDRGIRNG